MNLSNKQYTLKSKLKNKINNLNTIKLQKIQKEL